MYEPQVGDRVRRTYLDGTIMEGVIARVGNGWADSEGGFTLFDEVFPEQSELLERPFKLNTEPGTVYGDPDNVLNRLVRVSGEWLGYSGDDDYHWFEDVTIDILVTHHGWVEFNLDGSRKND